MNEQRPRVSAFYYAARQLGDKTKKTVYVILACVFLAIACLGVITPGLPTTEFVLLAAWCAAKGSQRLHTWLIQHPIFGKTLRHWQEDKSIDRRTKIVATSMMTVSIIILFLWVPHPIFVSLAAACMSASAVWIWMRPEPNTKVMQFKTQIRKQN